MTKQCPFCIEARTEIEALLTMIEKKGGAR